MFSVALTDIINEFLANEEAYGDNPILCVALPSLAMSLLSADEADEADDVHNDLYPVLDLVCMDTVNPGRWVPDTESIENLTAEYFK